MAFQSVSKSYLGSFHFSRAFICSILKRITVSGIHTFSNQPYTSQQRELIQHRQGRLFTASNFTNMPAPPIEPMADAGTQLSRFLNHESLENINAFWFAHLNGIEEMLILPPKEKLGRWFGSNPDFDAECTKHFKPLLEAIRSVASDTSDVTVTAQAIVAMTNPQTPTDWMALVILLDQLPRNIYRGMPKGPSSPGAKAVFEVFDPLALNIARRAVEKARADVGAGVRFRPARRMWFYLPFEHSEVSQVHENEALPLFENMKQDAEQLLSDDQAVTLEEKAGMESKEIKHCREVAGKAPEQFREFVNFLVDYELKHANIIKQFGRYPHRNEVLGRQGTEEERKYLAEGGETFSGKK